MRESEQIASTLAVLASGVPLVVIGWRTIVFPHDSPYWPVLPPLFLLILLVAATVIARHSKSHFWNVAQATLFYLALTVGLVAATMVLAVGWREFNGPAVEEPG